MQGAFVELSTSVEQDSSLPEAHYYLAALLQQEGDLTGAAREFRRAVELKPGYREAYYGLGTVLRKMGKEQEAQAAFREAERLQTILSNSQSAKNLNDEGYSLWSYTWPPDWRRGMLTSCTACPRKPGRPWT